MKTYYDVPGFATLERPSTFYFVRHGESEANKRGQIQGRLDPDLSEAGRAHARAAGAWFTERQIDGVFTSPLVRARETAREIAEATGAAPPVALEDLIELETGVFSGRRLDEVERESRSQWVRFQRQSWEAVPGAESIDSLTSRAYSVWNRLIAESNAGQTRLICVTHVGFFQWVLRTSFGTNGFQWMPVIRVGNCGISCLSVRPVAAGDGLPASFFAEWTMLNHLPYRPSE